MTSGEISAYIAAQPEARAQTLTALHRFLADRIAHAGVAVEEVMSYNMPGFRILSEPGRGSVLLGYAGWQAHLALYPHSGTILSQMTDLTHGMSQTRGALHLPIGTLPSEQIVDRMITLRLEELS